MDNTVFQALITGEEVENDVKEMSKTSAPGLDGIMLGHLVKANPKYSPLTETSLWLVTRTIPDALKDCQKL